MLKQKSFYLTIKLLLFLIVGFNFNAHSQQSEYNFENITIKDGLTHNNVYSIFQDKAGYLWFGTQDGLSKFDGYKFTSYRNNPYDTNSLASNNFGKIFQDSSGLFWFGTFGEGIDLYDPSSNKFENLSNIKGDSTSLSNDLITFIFEDSNSDIWIGTANGGLNKYNKEKGNFTRYSPNSLNKNSISDEYVRCICETSDGTIWVGTGNGLNKFNRKTGTFTQFYHDAANKKSLSGNHIQHMVVDDDDNIWLGLFRGGLNKLNPETGEITRYQINSIDLEDAKNASIDYLFIDSYNQFWLGTYEEGLYKFDMDSGEFTHIEDPRFSNQGLYCNRIEYIFEDRSNILWIATRGNGIWKLDLKPKKFNNLTRNPISKSSLSGGSITAVDSDKKGNIWIGTDGGGLTKYNTINKTYTYFQNIQGNINSLSANRVWSIYVDKDDIIWAGTVNSGLNRIENKNGNYYFTRYEHDPTNKNSISNNQVNTIKEDHLGNLWIGTLYGLNKLKKRGNPENYTFDNFYHNSVGLDVSVDNYIVNICIDYENRIWIASVFDGLMQFEPESSTFLRFAPKQNQGSDTIENYKVYHIFEDSKRNLWVGTGAFGVVKFDYKTLSFITNQSSEVLFGKTVYGIIEDNDDCLWISTSNSLEKFNPITNEFNSYGFNDGLVGVGFNRNAVCKDETGTLYFGSNSALSYFNPKEIHHNPNLPKTVITSINVLNKPILNNHLIPFEKFKNGKEVITLTRKDYFFTIEFAALDFTSPSENRYKYMLENFDKDWIDAGENRTATYTNLDPGTYVFKVKGCNNDKIWNENPTELTIKVIPPFWKRIWFYCIEIGLIMLFIYAYVRIRTYVLIEDKKNLAKKVASRTEQINQQKEELRVQAQHLAEVNDNLEMQVLERTADLEVAKNKAEESDQLKSAFLANMSHEIRTPMNAIIGFSELMKLPDIDDQTREEFADHIIDNGHSLLKLINDIIDISKLDVGQINLFNETFSLNDQMNELYIRCIDWNKNSNVQIKLSIEPIEGSFLIKTDELRLYQILENLLSNAIKFTEKGIVEFGYTIINQKLNNQIQFFVRDTGIGLSKEQLNVVFSRFTKIEDTKDKMYRGVGLGLYISKSLVELLGGNMRVESTLGQGSVFYFTLPLLKTNEN